MNIAVVIFPIIIMPSNVESVRKKRGMKSLTMRETSGNYASLSKTDVNLLSLLQMICQRRSNSLILRTQEARLYILMIC